MTLNKNRISKCVSCSLEIFEIKYSMIILDNFGTKYSEPYIQMIGEIINYSFPQNFTF